MGLFKSPGGAIVSVPDDEAGSRIAGGYVPVSEGEAGQTTGALTHEDTGALGGLAALGTGALSGVTLGASDVALAGLLKKGDVDRLADARAQHGALSTIGQVAGSVLPALVAPESLIASSPAAAVSKIGHGFATAAESAGAGVLGRAGYATAGAAAEGALYGGGEYLSQVALEDKPLSAEGFVGAMGKGALFAAPIGGALSLGGSALQRARGLFPQQQITHAAAQAVDKEASSAVGQAIADGDQMAAAVQRRIELTESKIGMAEAGEGTTRRVFGEPDPAALGDQAAGGVEKAQLTDALQRYQASKAQLSDWIREEADPNLEAALLGLKPEFVGDAAQRIERQAGKFGEPELAAGTPISPENRSLMDALDARSRQLDSTANIKRPAGLDERPLSADPNEAIGEALGGTKVGKIRPTPADTGAVPARPEPLSNEEYEAYKRSYRHAENDDQYAAGMWYSKDGDGAINGALRSGGAQEPKVAKSIADLDAALALPESRLPRESTLYRGLSGDWARERFANLRPGETFEDPAYTSTAHNVDSKVRNEEVVFNIHAPAGTPAVAIPSKYSSEGELILPRGAKFRVDSNELVPSVPTSDRWVGSSGHTVHPDGSVTVEWPGGKTIEAPPHRVLNVTLVSEAPPVAAVSRGKVTLEAPLDQLSMRQILKRQELLNNEFDKVKEGSPEYEALVKKWDASVARMDEIKSGKAIEPAVEWGAAPTAESPVAKEFPETAAAHAHGHAPESVIPSHDAIAAHETKHDAALEQTIPASEIAARGYYEPDGGHGDAVRTAKAKRAIADGQREAIKLNITESGKITVTDGRHRLAAAIAADAPIKVKWSTGYEPAPHDVHRGPQAAHATAPHGQVAPRQIHTEEEFYAEKDALRAKLTPDEIKQSLRYSREDYNDINRFLRGDARVPKLGEREAEIIPALDSVLEKGRTTEPLLTHRAVHFDPGEPGHELQPGDVWTDPAYMSTSYRAHNINRFGNTHFVITSPPGTPIAAIPSAASEGEFLLARGSRLRITGREEHAGDRITLHATVEPAHAHAPTSGDVIAVVGAKGESAVVSQGKPGWHKYLADNIGKAWKSEGSYASGFAKLERDWAATGGVAQDFRVRDPASITAVKPLRVGEVTEVPIEEPPAGGSLADRASVAEASKAHLDKIKAENPSLAKAIDEYAPTAKARKYHIAKEADGACDTSDAAFRELAPELQSHRFDVSNDAGLAELKSLYGMTDAQVAAVKKKYLGRMKRLGIPEEDFYHQVSVTPDGLAIDWTANQYNKLPVPYVYRLRPTTIAGSAEAIAPATRTVADDSLESLLAGMKGKLDAGADLHAMGAPARAEYAAAKATKTEEAAARFRAQARAASFEDSPMAAAERAANETAAHRPPPAAERTATDSDITAALARHGIDSTPRGGPAELEALVAGMDKPAPVTSVLGKRKLGGDVPVSSAEYSARQALGKRILQHGEDPIAARLAENNPLQVVTPENANETIAKILGKRVGKNVDMGQSITKAAKAIGDFEAASADLVQILGPEAPASAAAKAQAYRAATAGQADAAAASTAKAAAHIKDKLVPAQTLGKVGADVLAGPAAAPGAAASSGGSALGKMADVGTAMEVLKAMGVHVPAIGAIPVIGPVLSLFLKARAVMGIIGRKGGSIGRSVEGTIAGKSAGVRNRINAATVATLDGAARGARKAAAMSSGPAVTLGYKLFPGGADPKSKDPRVLYAARMDEISRALQPGAIEHAVSDRVQTADPHLQDAIIGQVQKGITFLNGKAPKQTVLPGMLPGDGKWQPSKAALEEWGKYMHAVNDPASVLEDLAKGHVSMEGAETLRVVYPGLFAEAQRTLLQLAPQMQTTMPYPRRVAISIMYQVPVDGTMTPSHIQYLQPTPAALPSGSPPSSAAQSSGPAFTAPLTLGQQMMPSLDRRAGA